MANNMVCRGRQTAFLHRLKPVVPCLFLMEHLSLSRPIEASLGPRYRCPVCGQDLWTIQAPWTGWQEWLRTADGRRHYKHRCNIMEDAHIAFRRMFGQDW